jgi:hypothetical protein
MVLISMSPNSIAQSEFPPVSIEPFPILTWVPPKINEQQLNWFKEAGFTVLNIYPDEEKYQIMKKHWNGNFILFKEWSKYTYDDMLAFHPEDEKKIGYLLGDEPLYDQLINYKVIADKMRAADPKRICLINLFPSYVGETRLGAGFLDYLKTYFELINPRYCSLDNYPLLWFDVQLPEYYYDNEMLRKFSQWNDSKQIGFVQLYSSSKNRDISESDVAWQVNSLLAYGCKGLWYFNFRHPYRGLSKAKEPEISPEGAKDQRRLPDAWGEYYKPIYKNFGGSSALGMDDKPSFAFEYVKKANAIVKAWGPVLLSLENTAVRHVVNRQPFAPIGTEVFVRGGEPFIKNVRALDVDEDEGYIVSYFKNDKDESFIMIVNKRHGEFMSCKGGQTRTIVLLDDNVKNLYAVSPKDASLLKVDIKNARLVIDMEAGEAVLYKVEMK